MPSGLFLVSTSLAFCLAGGLPLGPSALPGTWRLRGPGPGIKQGSPWDASLGQACESRGLTLALGRESDGSERQVGRKTFFRGPTNCESRSLPWALGPGEDTSERQGSRRICEAERPFQALPGPGKDTSGRQVAFFGLDQYQIKRCIRTAFAAAPAAAAAAPAPAAAFIAAAIALRA